MSATTTPESAAGSKTWEQHHEAGRRRFAEGDAPGAEQAFRDAIVAAEETGGDPLQLASSLSSLGQLKYQQKDYAQAEECFRRALELRERALGGDHPTVISSINNLAALYVARGALDEAEPLLQRAMAVTVKRVEATQADLAINLNNLVRLYVKRGDYPRAEPLLTQLLALKRPLGPEHPEVAAVLVTLAKLRQSMGQPDAAERIWRRVLAVRERTLAPTDPALATALEGLADACAAQGQTESELEMRERALTIREGALGTEHRSLQTSRARLAELRPSGKASVRGAPPAPPPDASVAPPMGSVGGNGHVANGTAPSAKPAPAAAAAPSAGAPLTPAAIRAKPSDPRMSANPTPTNPLAPTPAGMMSITDAARGASPPDLDLTFPLTPAGSTTPVPTLPQSAATPIPGARTSGATRVARSGPPPTANHADDVRWIEPGQVVEATGTAKPSSVPASPAARASAPPAPAQRPRPVTPAPLPVVTADDASYEAAPRKRAFTLYEESDQAAAGRGRGKLIGFAVAATLACIAAGVAIFGHGLLSGSTSEAATPSSHAGAISARTATAATSTPPASVGAGASAGAAPARQVAAPTATAAVPSHTAPTVVQVPARPAAADGGTHMRAVSVRGGPAPAQEITPPLPSVNVDAATRSIDEATKKDPKPEQTTPF